MKEKIFKTFYRSVSAEKQLLSSHVLLVAAAAYVRRRGAGTSNTIPTCFSCAENCSEIRVKSFRAHQHISGSCEGCKREKEKQRGSTFVDCPLTVYILCCSISCMCPTCCLCEYQNLPTYCTPKKRCSVSI